MASQYKTRCPHCEAQFRIGPEHLQQAGGKVRCGSCLEIFRATEHLVESPEGGAGSSRGAGTRAAPGTAAPAKKQPARREAAKKKPAAASGAPATPQKGARQQRAPDQDKGTGKPAQRWTLDDAAPQPPQQEKEKRPTPREERNDTSVPLDGLELSDSFLQLEEEGTDGLGSETFSDMAGAGEDKVSSSADESWAEELLQELEEEEGPVDSAADPATPRAGAPDSPEEEAPPAEASSLFDEDSGEEEATEPTGLFDAEPEEAPIPTAGGEDEDFFGLLDEAGDQGFSEIEIPSRPEEPQPFVTESATRGLLKWGTLSLVAMLVLAGQYLAFNFNELARTPQWRGFYASTCEMLGCTLPHPTDVRKLRGANLVVRSHARVEDALVVDALLFNEANHEQPFPVLELEFTSLAGQSVASRRFLPSEYLTGELSDVDTMPRDTPIRISFEIMDPGSDAVNYRMRLHPAPRDGTS